MIGEDFKKAIEKENDAGEAYFECPICHSVFWREEEADNCCQNILGE